MATGIAIGFENNKVTVMLLSMWILSTLLGIIINDYKAGKLS
jgi:hypothetical protein